MEIAQDRSVVVTVRASVEPLIPDRMVITLTRHPINPEGGAITETTPSIQTACRQLETWMTEFKVSADEAMYF